MIVQIDKLDAAALVLHMQIMQQSFKKLIKKQHGNEREKYMNAYEYIKSESVHVLENELENYELHLNIFDLRVLYAFLGAYTVKVAAELEKMGNKAPKADKEQIERLKNIKDRCSVLVS